MLVPEILYCMTLALFSSQKLFHCATLKMSIWKHTALYPEDGGSMDLRNDGILSQHYTEDGGSMDLRNVRNLPQQYCED
jgi:hypothetical protein